MEKEKLGKKWICPTTGKKFYDLNKEPVISPYTGELLEIINTEDLEKEKKKKLFLKMMIKRLHKFLKQMKLKILIMLNLISKYLMIVQKIQFLKLKMIILVMIQKNSDSNIDELEEFEIDEEIDDDLDDDEFLDNNDDNSVEDVIGSVKKNKEED